MILVVESWELGANSSYTFHGHNLRFCSTEDYSLSPIPYPLFRNLKLCPCEVYLWITTLLAMVRDSGSPHPLLQLWVWLFHRYQSGIHPPVRRSPRDLPLCCYNGGDSIQISVQILTSSKTL